MASRTVLGHAQDDEAACRCLIANHLYDWAITAAFYSALHFIDDAIFPLVVTLKSKKRATYQDFDDFYENYPDFPSQRISQHRARIIAITRVNGSRNLRTAYERLLDGARDTRYNHEVYTREEAEHALLLLERVKIAIPELNAQEKQPVPVKKVLKAPIKP